MNAITNVEPASHPLIKLKTQFIDRQAEFHAGLPAHIPVERFIRVILTACQLNPELLKADRASLFTSAMKAATDGLLPDNREGALVIYKTKVASEWIAKVSWMPMIAGIRKKVRNSDTIATWDVHTVHEKDHFEFELGDDPFIKHRPFLGDRGAMVAVYSVAVLKSGEKTRDVMSRSEVDYVRDTYSKRDRDGKFSGAWVKSYDEMAKKTVARRHSKVLPMSTDLDDLLRRDDELYDLEGKSDKRLTAPPKTLGARLDALAGVTNGEPDEPQPENGDAEDNPLSPHEGEAQDTPAPGAATEPAGGTPGPAEAAVGPLEGVAVSPPGAAAPSDLAAGAALGTAALADYLEGLRRTREADLVSPTLASSWHETAKAADAERGRAAGGRGVATQT